MPSQSSDYGRSDDGRSKKRKRSVSPPQKSGIPNEQPESVRDKSDSVDVTNIYGKTGGAYIPPARLRQMQAKITDKSSEAYQRIAWEALKKSIHGFINKVNVSNISDVVRQLLSENVVRGRGLLVRSLLTAQSTSPTFTHVFAALVAIVNSKFPQVGELVLKRLINEFRKAFRRNQKDRCLSTSRFLAQLVNQKVVHELIILELLTLLLEQTTDDSVEVAVAVLKECGAMLTRLVPKGVHGVFEHLRRILNEGTCDKRISYMLEVMFQIRRDGWKDHPIVLPELDLIQEDDQITHTTSLLDQVDPEDNLNVFRFDPNYLENEEKYAQIKASFFESDSEDGGSGSDDADASDSDASGGDEEDAERAQGAAAAVGDQQTIVDQTETNLVHLRRTIYLMLQSSLSADEAGHRLLQLKIKPGEEYEVASMVLDCCAQTRSYESRYGRLAQRLCSVLLTFGSQPSSGGPKPVKEELGPGSRYKSGSQTTSTKEEQQVSAAEQAIPPGSYVAEFEKIFTEQYAIIHRLETAKLRNVALFFAHLLHTDSISWGVLQCVHLNERDTTSSGRIFLKHLFLELCSFMGLAKLQSRLRDETLQPFFAGLLPRDNPKDTRFAINFLTTIGLGGLTLDLREHLQSSREAALTKKEMGADSELSSSEDESSSTSSSSSSSDDSGTESSSDKSEKGSQRKGTVKHKLIKQNKKKPDESNVKNLPESRKRKDVPEAPPLRERPLDTPFFNDAPNSPAHPRSSVQKEDKIKDPRGNLVHRSRDWNASPHERSSSLSPQMHGIRSAVSCVSANRNRSPPVEKPVDEPKRRRSPHAFRSDPPDDGSRAFDRGHRRSRDRSPVPTRGRKHLASGDDSGRRNRSPRQKRRSTSRSSDEERSHRDASHRSERRSRQAKGGYRSPVLRGNRSPFTSTDSVRNRPHAVRS